MHEQDANLDSLLVVAHRPRKKVEDLAVFPDEIFGTPPTRLPPATIPAVILIDGAYLEHRIHEFAQTNEELKKVDIGDDPLGIKNSDIDVTLTAKFYRQIFAAIEHKMREQVGMVNNGAWRCVTLFYAAPPRILERLPNDTKNIKRLAKEGKNYEAIQLLSKCLCRTPKGAFLLELDRAPNVFTRWGMVGKEQSRFVSSLSRLFYKACFAATSRVSGLKKEERKGYANMAANKTVNKLDKLVQELNADLSWICEGCKLKGTECRGPFPVQRYKLRALFEEWQQKKVDAMIASDLTYLALQMVEGVICLSSNDRDFIPVIEMVKEFRPDLKIYVFSLGKPPEIRGRDKGRPSYALEDCADALIISRTDFLQVCLNRVSTNAND